jgi:K+-transporting ATPase A subunit
MPYSLADSLLLIQFKLHVLIDMIVEEIAGGIGVFVLVVTTCFLSIIVLIWTLMIGAQNAELTPRRLCVGRYVARVRRPECFVLLFLF